MSSQNLISASVAQETLKEILQAVDTIKTKLPFLLTLVPEDVRTLYKASNGFAPFLELAYRTVKEYPQILPSVFDIAEFERDYLLLKDLTQVAEPVEHLNDGLQNSLTAVKSDLLTAGLEVYGAIKLNRDKLPGLNVVAEEMAKFFFRSARKSKPAAADAANQ